MPHRQPRLGSESFDAMFEIDFRRTSGSRAGGAARCRSTCLALTALAALIVMAALPAGALAAPTWLAPVDVSAQGQKAEDPQVAVDAAGDAVAVWQRSEGAEVIVQAASRPAGGTWGAPVELSVPGENAGLPRVAMDAAGDAVAVWVRSDGSHRIVQAASRPAGGTWGAPVELSVPGADAGEPEIAVDPSGDAVAVWTLSEGSDVIVQAASRPAGGSWGAPTDLSAAGEEAGEPEIAVDPSGDAVAVWTREEGFYSTVETVGRPAGGTWGAPVELSAPGVADFGPQVALDAAGTTVAVWERHDARGELVEAAVRPPGGGWGAPVELSSPAENTERPEVAVDPAGDAVAVWSRHDGGEYVAQAASRPAGGSWGAPTDLSVPNQIAFDLQVGVDPAGDAVAVWVLREGTADVAQAASRPAGGAWGAPIDLSAPGQEALSPQVAVDPVGDAVAVWEHHDGTGRIVQAADYDAVGPQLHSLSIPTTGTVGVPLPLSVSPFDIWSAPVATAWSFGDGAAASGTAVSHTYTAPGTYTVKVTGTDGVGNTTTTTGTVTISPAPAGPKRGNRARAARVVRVKGRTALLALTCGAGGTGCAGTVRLVVSAAATRPAGQGKSSARASSKRRPRSLVLGKAPFNLASGAHKSIKVPLTKKGAALVATAGRKGLKGRLRGRGVVGRQVVLKAVDHRRRR